jgi:hypothetical protein
MFEFESSQITTLNPGHYEPGITSGLQFAGKIRVSGLNPRNTGNWLPSTKHPVSYGFVECYLFFYALF